MCILVVFASVSAKCTYENGLFLKIICAQGLSEAVFDENARIKSDIFRISYVFAIELLLILRKLGKTIAGVTRYAVNRADFGNLRHVNGNLRQWLLNALLCSVSFEPGSLMKSIKEFSMINAKGIYKSFGGRNVLTGISWTRYCIRSIVSSRVLAWIT